jgi:hypothetical protein
MNFNSGGKGKGNVKKKKTNPQFMVMSVKPPRIFDMLKKEQNYFDKWIQEQERNQNSNQKDKYILRLIKIHVLLSRLCGPQLSRIGLYKVR